MKKLLPLLLILFVQILSSQGIEFFHGTWDEAKELAQKEEKLIFVDAFAKWCGPCKRMAKNVFTNPSVGEYFKENFISLKIDMEEAKGIEFQKEFPVQAYPTLFFIDDMGELIRKKVGGMQAKDFLGLAKSVIASFDRSGDYASLYKEGNRDFELVLKYIKALQKVDKPSLKITNDYLRNTPDLPREQKAEILFEGLTQSDSRLFKMFMEDRSFIEKLKGKKLVQEKIEAACWNTVYNSIDFESDALLKDAKANMSKYYSTRSEEFGMEADYECAKALADGKRMSTAALAIAKKLYKGQAEELHQLAEELEQYKSVDPDILHTSEKIAEMAVKIDKRPEYLLTFSRLLLANNKKKKALKLANQALQLSMMDKRLSREVEDLIEAIKAS